VVSRQLLISLVAGLLFGAGLALSGMTDPSRVRAFLDVAGAWDPTLAFVMGGALAPMALAWRAQRHLERPTGAAAFDLPQSSAIDARLVGGAALFGVGWGASGLCPGPAIANLALRPAHAGLFVIAMLGAMALQRMTSAPPTLRRA
jgi:uncharacterized membrane protein YedE/YeeE